MFIPWNILDIISTSSRGLLKGLYYVGLACNPGNELALFKVNKTSSVIGCAGVTQFLHNISSRRPGLRSQPFGRPHECAPSSLKSSVRCLGLKWFVCGRIRPATLSTTQATLAPGKLRRTSCFSGAGCRLPCRCALKSWMTFIFQKRGILLTTSWWWPHWTKSESVFFLFPRWSGFLGWLGILMSIWIAVVFRISPTQIFVAYRTWPPWSWAVWLTPLDEGLSPRHISSGLSLIWDSFSRRWCVHTSGRTVIFQSFWSQGLFTLLNYWGLQRASVSAGYIYWYLSYDRDQQTLAYGPNLAHDCFFVKKKLVEHSQVHLFMYCLWFFRASLVVQMVKNLETWVRSLGWEDSQGGEHGNPLQYSCLENPHGQRSLASYI